MLPAAAQTNQSLSCAKTPTGEGSAENVAIKNAAGDAVV
jgi:hypothetical protein